MTRDSDASSTKCNISEKWLEQECGCRCQHLVYESNDFIVFVDKDYDVDWCTDDPLDKITNAQPFNKVRHEVAYLESVPCHHSKDVKLAFKRILGECIVSALLEATDSAQNGLEKARSFIETKNAEISRKWILDEALFYAQLAFIAICFSSIHYPLFTTPFFNSCFWLAISFPFGIIGAFLSVRLRVGNIVTDCSIGEDSHHLEARARMFAGGFSAVVIALAIYSEIFMPKIVPETAKHPLMLLASCAAGFSERWAPSILEDLTKKKDKK